MAIKKFFYTSFQIAMKNLKQLRYQKGTLVMTVFAPVFGFFIMSVALGRKDSDLIVGTYNAPKYMISSFEKETPEGKISYSSVKYKSRKSLISDINSDKIKFGLIFKGKGKPELYVSNLAFMSDRMKVDTIMQVYQASIAKYNIEMEARKKIALNKKGEPEKIKKVDISKITESPIKVSYIKNMNKFSLLDLTGPGLTGVTIIFFVFIVSGISFLRERSSGTMERMLISPVSVKELMFGYFISFGLLSIIQVTAFQIFYYKVFKLHSNGSIPLVFLFSLCAVFFSLSFGMLISSFASTEFQVMQIIPIFLVPLIALSGLFDLPEYILKFTTHLPMTYAVSGFKKILLQGCSIGSIKVQIIGLLVYSVIFLVLTDILLNRYKPKFIKTKLVKKNVKL